jgi:hypothetical protein
MIDHFRFLSRSGAATVLAYIAIAAGAAVFSSNLSTARPAAFNGLNGTWSGSGQIKLDTGNSEALKCRAYYTDKGEGLGIALRCASASYKIDLRASLESNGTALSGSWEERSFNAAGNATGQATGNKISLSIAGGGLTASMAVTTTGASQTVAISTEGTRLRNVNIGLSKD